MNNLTATIVITLLTIAGCLNSTNRDVNGPEQGGRELWKASNFDTGGREKCRTKEPTPEQITRLRKITRKWQAGSPGGISARAGKISISVYFHIIEDDDGTGGVTHSNIKEQVNIMNKEMKHFDFTVMNVTRTQNSALYINENDDDAAKMVKSLRKGGFDTLNIFVAAPPSYWGWALTPPSWDVRDDPSALSQDYVLLHKESFPRDSYYDWVKGYTALHEIGHWLGLYHTFQNGCGSVGDGMDDTAAERVQAVGCPKGRDTCPNDPGDDPIDNFMDYSSDDCQKKFSNDQIDSMMAYWYENRAFTPPPLCTTDSKQWRATKKNGNRSRRKSCRWVVINPNVRCNVMGQDKRNNELRAFEGCCAICKDFSLPESGG